MKLHAKWRSLLSRSWMLRSSNYVKPYKTITSSRCLSKLYSKSLRIRMKQSMRRFAQLIFIPLYWLFEKTLCDCFCDLNDCNLRQKFQKVYVWIVFFFLSYQVRQSIFNGELAEWMIFHDQCWSILFEFHTFTKLYMWNYFFINRISSRTLQTS